MRRLLWKLAYPFTRMAHRLFGLSYKWVNVGKAAWHRERFDPLWHYEWFGDEIPEMPEHVNVCGIMYCVSVSEGLVSFRSRDSWSRMEFTRDPHDPYADLWYFEHSGHLPATHIDTAYRMVRAVYGGSHERKCLPLNPRTKAPAEDV